MSDSCVFVSGLLLPPKLGILSTVCDMLLNGSSLDVTLVPISISYDKVVEAETFPQELLGEPKKAEARSLLHIMHTAPIGSTHSLYDWFAYCT